MKKFMKQRWLLIVGGVLSLCTLAQADTLKMHDGRVFSGTYQGGLKTAFASKLTRRSRNIRSPEFRYYTLVKPLNLRLPARI